MPGHLIGCDLHLAGPQPLDSGFLIRKRFGHCDSAAAAAHGGHGLHDDVPYEEAAALQKGTKTDDVSSHILRISGQALNGTWPYKKGPP